MADTAVAKHPGGRPTDYRPEYCQAVVEFMAEGYTATAFAGEIGVSRDTIYAWASKHHEFSDALRMGQAKSLRWWEERLRSNGMERIGSDSAIIFALKNIGRHDWRDKVEIFAETKVEHTIDVDGLQPDELLSLAELVRKVKARQEEPALVGSGSTMVTNGPSGRVNGVGGKKKANGAV